MVETLRNAWKIDELRKKILYTLMILLVFRIGSAIPVPFMLPEVLQASDLMMGQGNLLNYINMLTGGSFSQATLFAMSISPYITASIVMQLLQVAIPALERLAKEGFEIKGEWCFERYCCPRFTTPDEKGNIILDICFYLNK